LPAQQLRVFLAEHRFADAVLGARRGGVLNVHGGSICSQMFDKTLMAGVVARRRRLAPALPGHDYK
jgi:hypothetical protein